MDSGPTKWPPKYDLLGVGVSSTTYEESHTSIISAAQRRIAAIVAHVNVHALVTASREPALRAKINSFELVNPDGHPVRWAMNFLNKTKLSDRVSGPDLMLELCRHASEKGLNIYLYGSSPAVLQNLNLNLKIQFPNLKIVGSYSPPFRPLGIEEDKAIVEGINESGAHLVFIGLGFPKQEIFAHGHRDSIKAIQICVGAAFDFHAGNIRRAPEWMQRSGLEWLYRLVHEPKRLWRRYLWTNSLFFLMLAKRLLQPNNS